MKENLENKIEAILFYLAEPVSVNSLAKIIETTKDKVVDAIKELSTSLESRGMRIISHDDEVTLVTAPEFSDLIEKIVKEEREKDLGRAGLETLTIVAYKGPVSKKEIEYIRGVNCQWALRNLLFRGLVERKNSDKDSRMVVYTLTSDTLRYLGLGNIAELPKYQSIRGQLQVQEEDI